MALEKQDIEIGSTYDSTGVAAAEQDLGSFQGKVQSADTVAQQGTRSFVGYSRALSGISIGARLAQSGMAALGGTIAIVGNAAGTVIGIALDLARAYLSMRGSAIGAAAGNWQLAASQVAAAGLAAVAVAA